MSNDNQDIYYINGQWVTPSEAKLSVFDISLLRGYGAFDFLRTYNRQPFLLKEHYDRLVRSSSLMGLTLPLDEQAFNQLVVEGIKRRPELPDVYVKVILTGGVSDDGFSISTPQVVLLFLPASKPPTQTFKLVTWEHSRFMPIAKSLNYMPGIVGTKHAKQNGADEIVFTEVGTGNLLEGVTSNFFAVIGGKLCTPEDNVLPGCTRIFILQKCQELGIEVVKGALHKSQIPNFEEAFLSSTTKEIVPVTSIDGHVVGKGEVGPVYQKLKACFPAIQW